MTPDAYIQVRMTSSIQLLARSGVFAPIRATISASPMLKRNCRTSAGTTSSQDSEG